MIQTVDDYVMIRVQELYEFLEHWKKNNEATPEDYPSQMDECEWRDQEVAFLGV